MSHNPLSASEPWNLVADGYAETTMLVFEEFADEATAASKLKPNSTVLDVACGPGTLALRLAHHAEQVHGIDFSEAMLRRTMAREGKTCAGLAGRDTAHAEEAADFGCVVGGGVEMMTTKKTWSPIVCERRPASADFPRFSPPVHVTGAFLPLLR